MKRFVRISITIFSVIFIFNLTLVCISDYDADKASEYITENHLEKSHCCCAWYVMRALQEGNVYIGILPAWAYEYVLPSYGFVSINTDSTLEIGDICVFPAVKGHKYGHIAMWNGENWISDFKQNNIIVAKQYKEYKLYRHANYLSYE